MWRVGDGGLVVRVAVVVVSVVGHRGGVAGRGGVLLAMELATFLELRGLEAG